jgi:general secretion pathway protein K
VKTSVNGPRRQRGIAALTAMLVVTIATVLAVELVWDLNLDLRRTETMLAREQGLQVAYGLELLAAQLLEADFEDDTEGGGLGNDDLLESWAEQYSFPFEGGQVVGQLADLQGRFNLNNLVTINGARRTGGNEPDLIKEQFRRLVRIATAELERDQQVDPDAVVESVIDWLDADQLADLGGAEDGFYTTLDPPYRAANFWFTSVSELQAVNGITPDAFRALSGLVSALPPSQAARPINVNTAPQAVLRSLSDEVTDAQLADWVERQQSQPFEQLQPDFFGEGSGALDATQFPPLGIQSGFFQLTVIVSIGTTRLTLYSLLEREITTGAVTTRYRSFDTE